MSRDPTAAIRPPTWTSASHAMRVVSPSGDSTIAADPRTKPGPPFPSNVRVSEAGGCLSRTAALPPYVPFSPATPTFSVAAYSSGPVSVRLSHPGIARRSTSGSTSAANTRSQAAGMTLEIVSFKRLPHHKEHKGHEGSVLHAELAEPAENTQLSACSAGSA